MSDLPQQVKKIKVFVIGSKEDTALSIAAYLTTHNDRIEFLGWTKTGQDGIDKFKELNPNMVLVDISTPDMNGEEVIRFIRDSDVATHIITMSESNDPSWIMKTIEAGADDYLSQPLVMDDLYNRINMLYYNTGISLREQVNKRKGLS